MMKEAGWEGCGLMGNKKAAWRTMRRVRQTEIIDGIFALAVMAMFVLVFSFFL